MYPKTPMQPGMGLHGCNLISAVVDAEDLKLEATPALATQ